MSVSGGLKDAELVLEAREADPAIGGVYFLGCFDRLKAWVGNLAIWNFANT